MPTARSTSVESDAPMKNIVKVRHLRAKPETAAPNAGILPRTKRESTFSLLRNIKKDRPKTVFFDGIFLLFTQHDLQDLYIGGMHTLAAHATHGLDGVLD